MVCCVEFNMANANTKVKGINHDDRREEHKENYSIIVDSSSTENLKIQWRLQHFAGGHVTLQPPIFSPDGEYLFIITGKLVQVYSTTTGVLSHKLTGAKSNLVNMEIDIEKDKFLIACSERGELLRWKWNNGEIDRVITLRQFRFGLKVRSFHMLDYRDCFEQLCALVTYRENSNLLSWGLVSTTTGYQVKVSCGLILQNDDAIVAANNKESKLFVICQKEYIHIVNYSTWKFNRLFNANHVPITTVIIHPDDELIATGDTDGKVFLWRDFMKKDSVTTVLYHWHHTPITCIAFSVTGSSFFSSGHEATLVKWNVKDPEKRSFVPRMAAVIRQIAVSQSNAHVAVCTADNGIQIVGTDNRLNRTIQEFTYIADDGTGRNKFPVGLCVNPRNGTLVLNGRVGHLQFYSVYTRHLLYNMDIVNQSPLSMEKNKILYNITVTKAAFNVDWMATGEVFDDAQHMPELRLKFWRFDPENQNYTLNTNIEMAHENGFRAIQFSTPSTSNNLLCASVGICNDIKVWALDDSDSIYIKDKVWFCIAHTSYKNYAIESICFSHDGSLLAAGYGNSLCLYESDTLKLKAVLSSPDTNILTKKAHALISSSDSAQMHKESDERMYKLLAKFFKDGNIAALESMSKTLNISKKKLSISKLKVNEKKALYDAIANKTILNFHEKMLLYHKLGIKCKVRQTEIAKLTNFLRSTAIDLNVKQKLINLHKLANREPSRNSCKAKYRASRYVPKIYSDLKSLESAFSNLGLSDLTKPMQQKDSAASEIDTELNVKPMASVADISHVQFLAGYSSNLVIVCTRKCMIVWNLLTLRAERVFMLTVKHLAYDSETNIIAAFTKFNNLVVLRPDSGTILYEHKNIPDIYGAIWMPRRTIRKSPSEDHWQSHSILYFLTKEQEIAYLACDDDLRSENERTPVVFKVSDSNISNYSTFGTYAMQQVRDAKDERKRKELPMLHTSNEKEAVRDLLSMSIHTMAPLSLLCPDFMKSLLTKSRTTDETEQQNTSQSTSLSNGNATDLDSQDESDSSITDLESDKSFKRRKFIMDKSQDIKKLKEKNQQPETLDERLSRIAEQLDALDFSIS